MTILNEGLDYHDLVNQMMPVVTVDKYVAKMGDDADIVTLAFTLKSKLAAEDVVDWFERGYDYVLDAKVSEGELDSGKCLVFVEMDRRLAVPERILELIGDLETLTDIPLKDWTIIIDDEDYEPELDVIKTKITLSPHDYRKAKETDLNEMRKASGMEPHKIYDKKDSILKDFIAKAGL